MSENLIICIGNIARGDDGVAHAVAALLRSAGIEVIEDTALDITHAAEAAESTAVVVVDAARRTAPAVTVEEVAPTDVDPSTVHGMASGALLGIVRSLYNADPPVWLVSVAAPEMERGEGLSETAEAASKEATSVIIGLVESGRF